MTGEERVPASHRLDGEELEDYRKDVLRRMIIGDFDAGDTVEIYGLVLERTSTPAVWNLYRPHYGIDDDEERDVDLFDTWLNTINVSAISAASRLGKNVVKVSLKANAEYAPESGDEGDDDPVPHTSVKGFQ